MVVFWGQFVPEMNIRLIGWFSACTVTDCVTVRINAPVAWSVTVRTRAAVGVANTLCDWQAEGRVAI